MLQSVRIKFAASLVWAAASLPAALHAQIALENALSTDIDFRGQGRAGLCYAFAEEQVLKDFSCKDNCDLNASEWKYSIFDIARAHQRAWVKKYNPIKADLSRDLFANGSSFAFPYGEVSVSSVRASKCTLEKEIFFLNRSQITNPKRGDEPRDIMADYLVRIYNEFKSGNSSPPPIENAEVLNAWAVLQSLAVTSKNEFEFMAKVIDYTKCKDRLKLPKFKVRSRDVTEVGQIAKLVELQLRNGRSLYVGVCAEVLEHEVDDGRPCGRHAVTLRRYNARTKEILVVDSAFFTKRNRNVDGSSWIPADLVFKAIAKSGRDNQPIRTKVKAEAVPQARGIEYAAVARQTIAGLREAIVGTRTSDVHKMAMYFVRQYPYHYRPGSRERTAYEELWASARKLTFKNLDDLDQLQPLLQRTYYDAVFGKESFDKISFHGIVWLDSHGS